MIPLSTEFSISLFFCKLGPRGKLRRFKNRGEGSAKAEKKGRRRRLRQRDRKKLLQIQPSEGEKQKKKKKKKKKNSSSFPVPLFLHSHARDDAPPRRGRTGIRICPAQRRAHGAWSAQQAALATQCSFADDDNQGGSGGICEIDDGGSIARPHRSTQAPVLPSCRRVRRDRMAGIARR